MPREACHAEIQQLLEGLLGLTMTWRAAAGVSAGRFPLVQGAAAAPDLGGHQAALRSGQAQHTSEARAARPRRRGARVGVGGAHQPQPVTPLLLLLSKNIGRTLVIYSEACSVDAQQCSMQARERLGMHNWPGLDYTAEAVLFCDVSANVLLAPFVRCAVAIVVPVTCAQHWLCSFNVFSACCNG